MKVFIDGNIIPLVVCDFSLETWSLVVILSVAHGKRRLVQVQVVFKVLSYVLSIILNKYT